MLPWRGPLRCSLWDPVEIGNPSIDGIAAQITHVRSVRPGCGGCVSPDRPTRNRSHHGIERQSRSPVRLLRSTGPSRRHERELNRFDTPPLRCAGKQSADVSAHSRPSVRQDALDYGGMTPLWICAAGARCSRSTSRAPRASSTTARSSGWSPWLSPGVRISQHLAVGTRGRRPRGTSARLRLADSPIRRLAGSLTRRFTFANGSTHARTRAGRRGGPPAGSAGRRWPFPPRWGRRGCG